MSQASSESDVAMFGSEEFGSGIDSGIDGGLGLDDASGGFIGQTSDEVAMGAPAPMMPAQPVKQKGFTLDSFLIMVSMLLMLTAAIILFSYMGSIEV